MKKGIKKQVVNNPSTAKKTRMLEIEDINTSEIVGRVLAQDRWMLVLKESFTERTRRVPQAQYNWLMNNPAFSYIPVGYVIHHLDNDELNDDVSNLVLMFRPHHTAYHSKYQAKTLETKIEILNINRYLPEKEPQIYKRKDTTVERYVLYWNFYGKRHCLTSFKGRPFKTVEDAEWAKAQIWQAPKDTKRCSGCNGEGFVPV